MKSIVTSEKYDVLLGLVKLVGKEIIKKRDLSNFEVFIKEDESQVSNVDLWANEMLCSKIKELFPDHIVIGEESDNKSVTENAPYIWFVDPIDGTSSFVKKENHFYILIGLLIDGIPSFGIVYKPTEDILIHNYNDVVRITKGDEILEPIIPTFLNQTSFVIKRGTKEEKEELKQTFSISPEPYIYDMVSMLGCLFGKSSGYIGFRRTFYWDLCGPAAILESLGFLMLYYDYKGKLTRLNNGEIKCRAYLSIPNDSPKEIVDWFEKKLKSRLEN